MNLNEYNIDGIIEDYGDYIDNFGASAIEFYNFVIVERDFLEGVKDKLSNEQKRNLLVYDLNFIHKAESIYNFLKDDINFSEIANPIKHWWWHVDKIAKGSLSIKFDYTIDVNVTA
ncbi:hypothetical protein [Bacillus benzoevorans]|uniref:Uncharacterized protein n=1 Tax=Bacillus benzoevorans TaxID=1456 RepID=A0A7X0HW45_9BACI|nr:hypothetical protein [Bacillus benzoevorans]MBB6446720.1 hypothetical protein [Bacillus benzoevorans]